MGSAISGAEAETDILRTGSAGAEETGVLSKRKSDKSFIVTRTIEVRHDDRDAFRTAAPEDGPTTDDLEATSDLASITHD